MARQITTIEVHGPRQVAVQALREIEGAAELPVSEGRPYQMLRLGRAHVIALWLEAQERMVITVHENDAAMRATATVFARLASRMPRFEIRHEAPDEICYEFAWAS